MINDDLKTRFNNADETEQDLILEDIIMENYGYTNSDFLKIELSDSHIEKIATGMVNGGMRVNRVIGIVSVIFGMGDYIKDESWKLFFDANYRVIKVYPQLINEPLSDDVFEYALRKYFESSEKLLIDCEDGMYISSELEKTLEFQNPLSEQCYKIIVDNDINCLPFIKEIPENVKQYIFDVVNNQVNDFDASKLNQYDDNIICNIIEQYPYLYSFIDTPSENVNQIMIDNNPYWIKAIKNQSEQLQIKTLISSDNCKMVYTFFQTPSKKVQYEALKHDGTIIEFIDNPDYKLQKMAIDNTYACIVYIDEPYEDIMIEVLEHNWNRRNYSIAKNNIDNYSDDFKHYFNKLKMKNGII